MKCPKCAGRMFLEAGFPGDPAQIWSCINCGCCRSVETARYSTSANRLREPHLPVRATPRNWWRGRLA